MRERVLVAVPGLGLLALAPEVYRQALTEGAEFSRPSAAEDDLGDEPVMTAEQLATALSLPTTWIEQAARENRIPCIRAGRWVRFKRSEVERALKTDGRAA